MVNDTALIAMSKGNKDCVSGDAIKEALEMPKIEAIGLTQATVHAPLLHTVKKRGMMELILPEMLVQIDLLFNIILLYF